jgi:hypothetical protein
MAQRLHRLTTEVQHKWTRLRVLLPYDEFEAGIRPILSAAVEVIESARYKARSMAQLDAFVLAVLAAVRSSVRLTGADRPRALLYSLLIARQLADLSAGRPVVQRLHEAVADATRSLYGDLGTELDDLDPAACWFTPGAVADPDASLIVDLYKIKSMTFSEYDAIHAPVLVPRSKAAKWIHTGRKPELFDSSWLPLLLREESMTRQGSEGEARLREIEASFAAQEHAERLAAQARLAEFDASLPLRQTEQVREAAAAEADCKRVAIEERRRAERELVELSQQFKPSISRARSLAERIAGWSFAQLEVPSTLVGALSALLVASALGTWWSLGLGALLGLALSVALRRAILAAPTRIERRFRDRLKIVRGAASARAQRRGAELRAAADRTADTLAAERAAILQQFEDRLREVRHTTQAQIAAIEATQQAELRARPLNDLGLYPAVVMGVENGFLRGKAPPKAVIKVMHERKYGGYLNSLSPAGRERLFGERNRLPRKEFDELIERLIS